MNGYLPRDVMTLACAAIVLGAVLLLGLILTRFRGNGVSRLLAWAMTVGGTASVEWLCRDEPAGVRMLALIGALLFGMKAIVSVESRLAGERGLPALNWLLFATLWPGMRPSIFAGLGRGPLRDARCLVLSGLLRLAIGAAAIALAAATWHFGREWVGDWPARTVATLLLLPGISLLMHFGVFNVAAGLWRYAGVDARPLFRAPLAARSLGDFWGRRWNLAFSEMTAIGVYRPLSSRLGKTAGVAGAFACSGLLHEVAISVPVLAGFGLPTLYFLLHGALVLAERRLERRGAGVTTWGWGNRVWVLAWLALPVPLLFHLPFLEGCVWPLIGME